MEYEDIVCEVYFAVTHSTPGFHCSKQRGIWISVKQKSYTESTEVSRSSTDKHLKLCDPL